MRQIHTSRYRGVGMEPGRGLELYIYIYSYRTSVTPKITHPPPRRIFGAGFLDSRQGVYTEQRVYATFSTKLFQRHHFSLCMPPLFCRKPGLKFAPRDVFYLACCTE